MIDPSTFIAVVVIAIVALLGAMAEHARYRRANAARHRLSRSVVLLAVEHDQAVRLMRRALRGGPHTTRAPQRRLP